MRIFAAELATETNTFAPTPTGVQAFLRYGVFRGTASIDAPETTGAFLKFLRDLIEADGNEMVESVLAYAQPSGRTVNQVYERFREELLEDLRVALPIDAVQLLLHGAMVADGYDDCEGDLIERIRAIVGPSVPIGVELDLHCHFTRRMHSFADVIIAFKEYPHIDITERAAELYKLLLAAVKKQIKPTTGCFDCRMTGIFHTTREPMAKFVKRMTSFEGQDGVLSVSLGHGFPWGDVPEAGVKVWVVTDNDQAKADALAIQLGREFWDLREQVCAIAQDLDGVLDLAVSSPGGLTVVADVADNPGGGAPGDSTFILRRMVERNIGNSAIGAFCDVGAIAMCKEAGVGASFELRLGGKAGSASGQPLDLRVTVRAIVEDHYQSALEGREPMGPSVWVQANNGLDIAIVTLRQQVFSLDAFTGLGIELGSKQLVVVKSTQHFHAEFAPIASQVLYASTPGALSQDFAAIPYKRRDPYFWPRVVDPHTRS